MHRILGTTWILVLAVITSLSSLSKADDILPAVDKRLSSLADITATYASTIQYHLTWPNGSVVNDVRLSKQFIISSGPRTLEDAAELNIINAGHKAGNSAPPKSR